MKRTIFAGCLAGLVLTLSVGLVQSSPSAGSHLTVRAIKARLMARPHFLGASNGTLFRGTRVTVLQTRGPWYQVRAGAKQGWVYRSRVTKRVIKLRSGATGSGTTTGEAELAGRGFSESTEKRYESKHPDLDFKRLDAIQQYDVDPSSVGRFYQEGGLNQKGGL